MESALVLKLLGVACTALLSLILAYARQIMRRVEESERQLLCKIAEHSTARQTTDRSVQDTRELLIRTSERIDSYIKAQDVLIIDFKERFSKSDELHMLLLSRLAKMVTGKTPSPLDLVRDENGK